MKHLLHATALACTLAASTALAEEGAWDRTKEGAHDAAHKTEEVGEKAWEGTKHGAHVAADKTGEAWNAAKKGTSEAWHKTKKRMLGD